MRSFKLLPSMAISALCLSAHSPARSQDSIPIYPIVTFEGRMVQTTTGNYGGAFTDINEPTNDTVNLTYGNSFLTTFPSHEDPDSVQWVPGHVEESAWAFKLGYQLGTVRLGCGGTCTYAPHVGLAIGFSAEWEPLDLTGATHVTFWAKAKDSITLDVSIGMRDSIKIPASYSQRFIIDTTWKKYSIELKASADFALPEWVTPQVPFEAARANAINFSISKDNNPVHVDNALYLDDIEIVNWVYTPWVDPAGISQAGRKPGRSERLRAQINGDRVLVRLPEAFLGKSGAIEALDAAGRKVGRAGFGPQAMDVSLKIPAASANSPGLYFRAVSN